MKQVTVSALEAHVNLMNTGFLNFSDLELNNRADLVRFHGVSIQDAASMAEGEVYDILEGDSNSNEWSHNYLGIYCECESNEVKIKWINGYISARSSSSSDGYICKCKCGEKFFIDESALDCM